MKIFLLLFFIFPVSASAQIFSSNYEDCILKGLENARTNSAAALLKDACEKKFPSSKGAGVVSECNLTWNGDRFMAGSPRDESKFIAIRFSKTPNMIFMPEHMDKKLWRNLIISNKTSIKSICPGINFE